MAVRSALCAPRRIWRAAFIHDRLAVQRRVSRIWNVTSGVDSDSPARNTSGQDKLPIGSRESQLSRLAFTRAIVQFRAAIAAQPGNSSGGDCRATPLSLTQSIDTRVARPFRSLCSTAQHFSPVPSTRTARERVASSPARFASPCALRIASDSPRNIKT